MTSHCVEVEGLGKTYSVRQPGTSHRVELVAVEDVSFQIASGAALGIVGESGSGKTTTARVLIGLERPTKGRIVIDERERRVGRIGHRERRRRAREAQMVFQDPYTSLDPHQRVGAAIEEVLRMHSVTSRQGRQADVIKLLGQVGLDPAYRRAYPRALSGGQRQRVAVARAVAMEPRLLVLDEPTSALDVSIQAQLLELLGTLRTDTGITYLFVSHDLAVIHQMTENVVVMQAGRIVEHGRTDEVLSAPQHPYTRLLLESVPRSGWKPKRLAVKVGPAGGTVALGDEEGMALARGHEFGEGSGRSSPSTGR